MSKRVPGKSFDEYKPVKNPLGHDYGFEGCMIETFGDDIDMVRKQWEKDKTKIWTVLDGEGSNLDIVAGFHFVNRLGYIITEVSWESPTICFEGDKRVSN